MSAEQPRRVIGILAIPLLLALCSASVAFAQQLPPPQSATAVQQPSTPSAVPLIPIYPDSPAGLEKLMKDMLKLERRGDASALARYVQSLVLPDADAWFKSEFGDALGSPLALSYEPTAKWLSQSMAATLKNLLQQGIADHFQVVDSNNPCESVQFPGFRADTETKALGPAAFKLLAGLKKKHEPMYVIWFHKRQNVSAMAFFVYDDGAFRYLGKPAISDLGTSDSQAHTETQGSVRMAKLIYHVEPEYPPTAKEAHVQGVVLLSAEIVKDGSVQDVSYVSGPTILGPSAMDAVKQWKYEPTMLNGTPVSVHTCITVIFNLGSR